MNKSEKTVWVIGIIIFLIIPILTYLMIINHDKQTISAGPISETIIMRFGEKWYNERHDKYNIYLGYSGIFMDHYTFAPITVGAWHAYAYNIFIDQTRFSMGGVNFEVLESSPQYIKMKITYPYGILAPAIPLIYIAFGIGGIVSLTCSSRLYHSLSRKVNKDE